MGKFLSGAPNEFLIGDEDGGDAMDVGTEEEMSASRTKVVAPDNLPTAMPLVTQPRLAWFLLEPLVEQWQTWRRAGHRHPTCRQFRRTLRRRVRRTRCSPVPHGKPRSAGPERVHASLGADDARSRSPVRNAVKSSPALPSAVANAVPGSVAVEAPQNPSSRVSTGAGGRWPESGSSAARLEFLRWSTLAALRPGLSAASLGFQR